MALRSFTLVFRDVNRCINLKNRNYFQTLQSITTVASKKWNVVPQDIFTPTVYISRKVSSVTQPINRKESIFKRIYTRITGRKYMGSKLARSALRMYLCTMEVVDHEEIMRRFNLPDTLNSWFRITELHMWMLLSRLSKEGDDGKEFRTFLMEHLWQDLDKKVKQLRDVSSYSSRSDGVRILGEQFKATILSYDEGILDNDKALAGALWRNFFGKNCKAVDLELMVEYVHKQMAHLHRIPSDDLLRRGEIKILPIFETEESKYRYEKNFQKVLKILP